MTPAEIEGRNVVARRLFDALCAQYPEKYVALTLASLEPGIVPTKKRGSSNDARLMAGNIATLPELVRRCPDVRNGFSG